MLRLALSSPLTASHTDAHDYDAKALTQQQFGAHAAATSPRRAPHGYSLDRLIEWIAPQPGQRILDLATGGGHTALALARAGARIVAADLTAPMLCAARAYVTAEMGDSGSVAFVRLDAEQLSFPAASFDAVTCRIAPHHFPDVARFVRNARAVRPAAWSAWWIGPPARYRRRAPVSTSSGATSTCGPTIAPVKAATSPPGRTVHYEARQRAMLVAWAN